MRSSVGEVEWQALRRGHLLGGEVDIVRQRVRDHLRLLIDFLEHEVTVVALVDQQAASRWTSALARCTGLPATSKISAPSRVEHAPIAVFQIGDRHW